MQRYCLSDSEKIILRALYNEENIDNIKVISEKRKYGAAKTLKDRGFVLCNFADGEIYAIDIEPLGEAYMEEYPELDDPINAQIEELTKKNLILQNNELEHKCKIRKQEAIIRWWKVATVAMGLISLILTFLAAFL